MNDVSFIVLSMITFLAGILVTWIIRKLLFEKNHIPLTVYAESQELIQSLKTQHVLMTERVNQLSMEKDSLSRMHNDTRTAYDLLIQEFARKDAQASSISLEKENMSGELKNLKVLSAEKEEKLRSLMVELANKDARLKYQQEQQENYKREMADMGEKLKKDFQILASTILDEKSQKFTQLNSDNLKTILDPLKKDLGEFKTRVEETYDRESKERFSLGEKIKDLVDLNQRISDEAQNLTRALKGEVKKQGDWGEMILESVLEKSGLVKNREYFIQEFIKDEAGNIIKNEAGQAMKPDVMVYYPDKGCLVVDSKVSLNAYERFANADEKELQETELRNHIQSLRSHIDGLSSKNYQNYLQSLDWVIMFVPIEPAYLVALRKDPDLWHYAYAKKIIMVCPSNLLAVLKITADLWKREYQNQNALEIAERGGKLYDKFVNFVTTMQELGDSIHRAQFTYDKAFGQLKTGSGNLIRQAEMMKQLEIKATKQLPAQLVNEADAS